MEKPDPRTADWQMAAVDRLCLNVCQMLKAARDFRQGGSNSGERPEAHCSPEFPPLSLLIQGVGREAAVADA